MKLSKLVLVGVVGLVGATARADTETFYGWSRDGTWFAWQKVSGPNDLVELNFCVTDTEVSPTWPAVLNEAEKAKVERHSCVTLTDPNRAPMGWKSQLQLPKPAFSNGKMRVLTEMVLDGENPGYVVEEKDRKTTCYVSGLRESSKIAQVWWHGSGRWVAAMVDGHLAHCERSLKVAEPVKVEKKKGKK